MDLYNPPAEIDDFSRRPALADQMKQGWHQVVTNFIISTKNPAGRPSELFFDLLADTSGIVATPPVGIPWNGFPLFLSRWFASKPPSDAERLANHYAEVLVRQPVFGFYKKNDEGDFKPLSIPYRCQDEYCEWHVVRENGKITRIDFTVEPPEYWEFIAKQDFSLLVELYRELLHNPDIAESELQWQHDVYEQDENNQFQLKYKAGDYNPWNVWNTEKGAVHLTHWANTLGAEVQLASDSTLGYPVQAETNGKVDSQKLMCCAAYGGVNRSSDPTIGAGVFDLASQGLSVALANPIGLYMLPFELSGLLDPDDNFVGDTCLKFVRKSVDGTKILRAKIAPPQGASYTLDQCTLDGSPLEYGGQIARQITMALFGVAKKIPEKTATKINSCQSFCCTYPTNSEFFGTFRQKPDLTCDKLTTEDWARRLRDVPTEEAAMFAASVSEFANSETDYFIPSGRKLVSR